MTDRETGVVKTIMKMSDEDGRIVLRVIVDFYDGSSPPLTFSTVWKQTPVKIIEADSDEGLAE